MKKFFVLLLVAVCGLCGRAQDINYNFFPMEKHDTIQITTGVRFGSMSLSPFPEKNFKKKVIQDDPRKIGIGNFILDTRVRFVSDSTQSHDGVFGTNLSMLRSKAYIGYQYTRPVWYASARFGYEVYRKNGGEVRIHTKLFSENLVMVGFEGGFTPLFFKNFFKTRFLVEYDFGNFGWYGSCVATMRVFEKGKIRIDAGSQYDGIYGYGFFSSGLIGNTLIYFSTFQGQFKYQETRFPEQRFGMEKGFSVGIQRKFN